MGQWVGRMWRGISFQLGHFPNHKRNPLPQRAAHYSVTFMVFLINSLRDASPGDSVNTPEVFSQLVTTPVGRLVNWFPLNPLGNHEPLCNPAQAGLLSVTDLIQQNQSISQMDKLEVKLQH